jgi:quercetin dioxygenase-like cupin family protein
MNVYEWKALGAATLMPGITGKNIVGQNFMLCRFQYAPKVVEPVHSHESEQFSCVIEGRVRFVSEGREVECGPGQVVHFPSHQPHGVQVLDDPAELIEIFSPIRPDLILAMSGRSKQIVGSAK